MTDEELDRIERAEEIQRYTENRCEALEKENTELKTQVELLQMNIEKMKCSGNCQTWNEWQCPYARNREKEYVHPNMDECPCDKWKIKVVEND